jgi:hypothetical protein
MFVPRAILRDPDSEASKKLKARGFKGDPLDKAGLVSVLRGSEAVFAVRDAVDVAKQYLSCHRSPSLSSSIQTWKAAKAKADWCRERILPWRQILHLEAR